MHKRVAWIEHKRRLARDVRRTADAGMAATVSIRKRPLENTLPTMLSCRQTWPGSSLPSAARQANFALVPVPQGERS